MGIFSTLRAEKGHSKTVYVLNWIQTCRFKGLVWKLVFYILTSYAEAD